MSINFGVAGFPPNFQKSEYRKKRENIFEWLHNIGLDWIELQNTYGVKMPPEQAIRYRALAEEFNIGISIHAPYYIAFASRDPDVVERSKKRMIQCFDLAKLLGSKRIVFHPGYPPGKTEVERQIGINMIIDSLLALKHFVPEGICVYPETAGKRRQLGSLDEILQICDAVDYAFPCLDMAHIHSFELGSLMTADSIKHVLSKAINSQKEENSDYLHIHMYPVEYDNNGEKQHKAFADMSDPIGSIPYYPTASDFITALSSMCTNAVIVCEARDTQDVGAILMKKMLCG